MKLKLVRATPADREFLITLRKKTMVAHLENSGLFLSKKQHAQRVDDQFERAFVMHLEHQRIGVLKYTISEDVVTIMQIQITPEFQNRGYGGRVVKHVIDSVKPKPVCLRVLKVNPAYALYRRLGFHLVNEDKLEYHLQTQP